LSQAESSSLKLTSINAQDEIPTFRWRNNPEIFKWCRQREPISEREHLAWFESQAKDPNTKMYGIVVGELVGVCGLTSIDWINRRAEFSLYVGPEHQGKGYGERALRKLLGVAFNVHNLHLVWGESFEGNPAAKMFERVGFKLEGIRNEFYFRDGKYIDAHLWGITSDEFRNMASTSKRGVKPCIVGNPPGPAPNEYFTEHLYKFHGQELAETTLKAQAVRKAERKARRQSK
jgi:UDP-4-amino-4,6-dideoxy-N-acetyl-beta-L-altrosamine N-acetyltransferase